MLSRFDSHNRPFGLYVFTALSGPTYKKCFEFALSIINFLKWIIKIFSVLQYNIN